METPDEDCLSECCKVQNRNWDLVADVKRLQRAGLEVQAGFIVGFDHDRPSIFQRQIDFIQESGIVTAMVGLLQAPRGTRLCAHMKQAGRLSGDSSGDNVDGTTNVVPAMGLAALKAGYNHILNSIYAPGLFCDRIRTFLREYRKPRIRGRFRLFHLLAAGRFFLRIGLLGKGRFHFWKLLLWTQLRRPRMIPEVMVLAI